jgi:hypothetical protein
MNSQLNELLIAYVCSAAGMLVGMLVMRAGSRAYWRWPVYSAMGHDGGGGRVVGAAQERISAGVDPAARAGAVSQRGWRFTGCWDWVRESCWAD